jgi:ribosomal protein S12 methylthiotransferase accessory factor
MHVGIVGGGPAAAAVRSALEGRVSTLDPGAVGWTDLAVVLGPVGADGFARANAAARETETPWLAVELGGVGGRPLPDVTAAVSGYAPGQGCYDCLRTRVAANVTGEADNDLTGGADVSEHDARFAGAVAGREAARLVSGEPSPALGGVIEVPHARRRFLPVPGCDCGAGPERDRNPDLDLDPDLDRALDRDHTPRELEAALEAAERALDPRVGIVSEVGEVESFPVPYYLAHLSDTSGFSDATASRAAAGVAADWNPAFMKALGEALERYAAGVYRTNAFEPADTEDVPDAVPPSEFVTPDEWSPDDGPIRWIQGEGLSDGGSVHLPVEFVVFPPPEIRHRPSITTGLGLGNGGVEALLSGLYEAVERDAAMLAWYSSFEPLGLDVDDDSSRTLVKRARAEDLEITLLLLTQDVDVPVVAGCVHREGAWPRFAAGMSADLDPAAAARGALEEALQNWTELDGMGPEEAAEESGAIGRYADFPDAAREFVSPETAVPASTVGQTDPPAGEAEVDALVDRATDAGLTPYAARLTPRDLDALGFEAVRVLMPEAQPLFHDEPYFGERARRVPRALGFAPRLDREHHPFP